MWAAYLLKWSIPIFYAAIVSELLWSLYKKRKLYMWNDSISNFSCAMMNEFMKLYLKGVALLPYTYVYENFRVEWMEPTSIWSFLIMALGVDFGYYWAHREMHMINIGWLGHATHHSSEYVNYLTSFRQSMFGHFFHFVFYLPLALFFPPQLYLLHYGLNMFFQFWIHTELVGKLHPWFEYIFNSPSHHRVHHARNPEYLDKNFAGVLIIWDRIFGTFAEEKTRPVYGLLHTLSTWDVLWSQIHHGVYIAQEVKKTKGVVNKLKIVFAPPGWTLSPDGTTWIAPEIPAVNSKQEIYNPPIPFKVMIYTIAQSVFLFLFASLFLYAPKQHKFMEITIIWLYFIFRAQVYGMIMNKSRYGLVFEGIRFGVDVLISSYIPYMEVILPLRNWVPAFQAVSAAWLFLIREEFGAKSGVTIVKVPTPVGGNGTS